MSSQGGDDNAKVRGLDPALDKPLGNAAPESSTGGADPAPDVLDLTEEDIRYGSSIPIASTEPKTVPYDLTKAQEGTRAKIAVGLVFMLGGVLLLAFLTFWCSSPESFERLERLMTIIFGPVIALVGTAIGYYFGGRNGNS